MTTLVGLIAGVLTVWCGGIVRGYMLLRGRAGHAKLFVSPAAKIDQLATLRAERPGRIVIPFRKLAAGRALHESRIAKTPSEWNGGR